MRVQAAEEPQVQDAGQAPQVRAQQNAVAVVRVVGDYLLSGIRGQRALTTHDVRGDRQDDESDAGRGTELFPSLLCHADLPQRRRVMLASLAGRGKFGEPYSAGVSAASFLASA